MVYVCFICKREFKTEKTFNKHAKEFKLRFKIYTNGLYTWIDLSSYLDIIMELK